MYIYREGESDRESNRDRDKKEIRIREKKKEGGRVHKTRFQTSVADSVGMVSNRAAM